MDEITAKRAQVSLLAGGIAFCGAALFSLVTRAIRRDVDPDVPITAGLAVTVTVFVIDWLSDRRSKLP